MAVLIPPGAMKLYAIEHLELKPNSFNRIIDPNTGFQYEVSAPEVNLICPICKYTQAAPTIENLDYACPKCKWRYKLIGDMLVVWDPRTLGVTLPAAEPGESHFGDILIDGGGDLADPSRAAGAQRFATDEWLKARANNEGDKFGKKIQILTPEKKDEEK